MQSVLLFVHEPVFDADMPREIWDRFVTESMNLCKRDTAVETLGESCWLISLQKSLYTFVALLSGAHTRQLKYRVVFLPEEPRWIEARSTS